jgi:hypothetical protein
MNANIYAATPTLLEMMIEFATLLEQYKTDVSVTKQDVIDTAEDKISLIMGKLISVPTNTSFALYRSNRE